MTGALEQFKRLLEIMDRLRAECPWDKKQTLNSLRHLTIEEVYELSDAIMEGDMQEIKKELGDLFLHLVFYSKIGSEQNAFDVEGVLDAVCEKLIHRHPHIYGNIEVQDEEEVKANWEKLKLKEGKKSVLEGVPVSMPALLKAIRIQDKASGIGFDWQEKSRVWDKVKEEMEELEEVVEKGHEHNKIEEEFGDVLFSLVNYARFLKINPEDALERCNKKFISRFQHIENKAREKNKQLVDMSLEEMEKYWNDAKTAERKA
jgi:XTP/dITP diphosphohydrolase